MRTALAFFYLVNPVCIKAAKLSRPKCYSFEKSANSIGMANLSESTRVIEVFSSAFAFV